jgi:anionic cell wall polymer biosynthesis LytR-Cps2A-Psr (LCP) family protein
MRQRSPRLGAIVASLIAVAMASSTLAQSAPDAATGPPAVAVGAAATEPGSSLMSTLGITGALDIGARIAEGVTDQVAQAVTAVASNPCSGSGSTLRKTSNDSFTILLLGSDYRRRPYIGERLDTVIVLNVARNGRAAMVAIPRDTVQVPLASGGNSGSRRVNSLYIGYKRTGGRHGVDCRALDRVRRDIAKALGTEIPYYAMIRMDQFQELIASVDGIRMSIKATLIDYHHKGTRRDIYVPKSSSYWMYHGGRCGQKPKKCRNALLYARSRYGSEGGLANSDFRRLRRQQEIVFYAIRRVVNRGRGSNLSALLDKAKGRIYTNLPKTPGGARALYDLANRSGFRFASDDGKVFGPSRWASYVGRYTFKLRLSDVRQWVDNHFRP